MTREDIVRRFGAEPKVAVAPQPVHVIDFMLLRQQLNDFTTEFKQYTCPVCNIDVIKAEIERGGIEYFMQFGKYAVHEPHPCTCPNYPDECSKTCALHGENSKLAELGKHADDVVKCPVDGCVHGKIASGVECGNCHGSGFVKVSARAENSSQAVADEMNVTSTEAAAVAEQDTAELTAATTTEAKREPSRKRR